MDNPVIQTAGKAAKSKTVHLGLWLAVAGFMQTQTEFFSMFLTPQQQGFVTMAVGLAVVVLRFYTTVPVSEK